MASLGFREAVVYPWEITTGGPGCAVVFIRGPGRLWLSFTRLSPGDWAGLGGLRWGIDKLRVRPEKPNATVNPAGEVFLAPGGE